MIVSMLSSVPSGFKKIAKGKAKGKVKSEDFSPREKKKLQVEINKMLQCNT